MKLVVVVFSKQVVLTFNPPLAGMVVETVSDGHSSKLSLPFNPPLAGMVVETY